MSDDRSSYTCKWRTRPDTRPRDGGEVVVKTLNVIDAIAAAKEKVHSQTGISVNDIVVYEVEEPFL